MSRRRGPAATSRVLACALLLLGGCRTAPAPPGETLAPTAPEVQAAIADLAAEVAARSSLRGSARVSLEGARGSSFARHLVVLERPARIRLEVMGLVGQRVAVLATDGERFDLFRAETGQVESGVVHPGLLGEVAGVPLSPEELVAVLLGGLPLPLVEPRTALRGADGRLALSWPARDGETLRAILDAAGRLRALRVGDASGQEHVAVAWEDYRPVGTTSFAHRVELDFASRGLRAEVDFRQIELDPELPEGLFRLELVSSPGG